MKPRDLLSHALVVLAVLGGIIGFGLIYDAFAYHNLTYISTGGPLLFVGLWWAGRELARSNLAARRRKVQGADRARVTAGDK